MKTQQTITLVVVTTEQTREITLRDQRRLGKAEKQAAHWTKWFESAGHTVTRK